MIGLREQGIVVIAAVFGWIGGGVAYVLYDFTFVPTVAVIVGVALVVAVALLIGWRDPAVRPMGYGVGPVQPVPPTDGGRKTPHTGLPQTPGAHAHTAPAATTPAATTVPHADLSGVALSDAAPMEAASAAAGVADGPMTADAPGAPMMPVPEQPYDATHDVVAPSPQAEPVATGGAGAAPAPAAAGGQGLIKPSATLAGQNELAARKGSWTYAAAAPQPVDSPAAAATVPDASHAPVTTDADRPAAMTAPRGGVPDDLKLIRGVGPKLEELLHSLGIYHFDQIAGWQAREVAWMDDNLKGFKGRVSREDWIGQSRTLAAGGETPHSIDVTEGRVN